MEIQVEQITPWRRALNAARWTVGKDAYHKEPTEKFKVEVLMPQHSPIRMVEYDIKIKDIPYRWAVHFVRHHVGVEKFQSTLRDDRNEEIKDSDSLPQDYPVNLWMTCNADALIAISRRRLCSRAATTTCYIWNQVKEAINKIDPIIARFMVKECVYRGFCPEKPTDCCGYAKAYKFARELKEYRRGFITYDNPTVS